MDRRLFLKSSGIASAALIISPLILTGCPTSTQVESWLNTAVDDMPTIGTILQSVAAIALDATGNGILDIPAQAVIQAAVGTATVALKAAETAIAAYKANPTASALADVEAAFVALQPQLVSILNAVHISNAALVATISGAVNLAISVIASIQLLIPGKSSAMLSAKYSRVGLAKPVLLKRAQIIDQYNTLVTINGYQKHRIHKW